MLKVNAILVIHSLRKTENIGQESMIYHEKRMIARKNHYMKPELLQSQFDTMEVPSYGFHVNINQSINDIRNDVVKAIRNYG